MRGVRSFIVLLVVLIGLGSYLYFVESKRNPDADKKDKAFTVPADKIDEITVKSESGEQTTIKKSGDDWQIAQPVTAQPDSAEVSGLTTNLASLEVGRVIDENPGDLGEYGLAQPRIEVAFKAGSEEHRLQIGRKTPPGTDLYAKLANQKRVFLIPSYLESTFNKKTFDLRDKTVLKLERDKIDRLAIATPARTLEFAKENGEWRMTVPLKARADFTTVDGLVSRLHTLQMKALVAAEAANLTEYGLDKPSVTIRLGSGSSLATLLVGKESGDGVNYAKDQSRPAVFSIEKSVAEDASKDPSEYRQKDLFDARAFNTTRIDIARGSDTFAFEKVKAKNKDGQEEEKWRQVAPAAKDADQTKVDNLIAAVTGARATGFAESTAKAGLDTPELTVTLKFDDGKREEKVAFARTGSDGFASRAGEPGAAKVDIAAIENIVKSLDAAK
ncbi:MAG TPA: DUF4340 domain-containing protein [Vicinamibacterales bacterium]|nr:DUF4340 domain-containing protein [Vicinamibacterales bacterium]